MSTTSKEYNVIIDKVAFTMSLDELQQDRVFDRLVNKKLYKEYNGRVYYDDSSYRYNNNYLLEIVKGEYAEVSIYPYDPEHNFIRAEYNPTKLKVVGRKEMRRALIKMLNVGVVKKIFFHAPVTRLDLTVDVFNMQPNLFIHYNRATHSELHKVDNIIQSQVVGSDRSDCRITMYDKNAERRSQGKAEIGKNYQRIEMRLRNLRTTMNQLGNSFELVDKLESINFFNGDFLLDRSFSQSFRRLASKHGLNMALSLQERNDRICYRRYLEEYREHPISISDEDYSRACRIAFGSLVHTGYSDQFLSKAA